MNPFKAIFDGVESITSGQKTDVVSLIKADHRKVDALFETYIKSKDDAEKENVLKEIISNLRVHATAEENKVYPSLDSADHEGTNESLEEHHLIKILIEELSSNRLAEDKVDAKVKVLSEVVRHHVKEEENKYLPELQGSGADLQLLGQSFTSEKERLLGQPDQTDAPEQVFTKNESVLDIVSASSPEMKEDFPRALPDADLDVFAKVPLSVLADDAVEVKDSQGKKSSVKKPKKTAAAKKAAPAKKVVATKKIAPAKKIGAAKKSSASTSQRRAS